MALGPRSTLREVAIAVGAALRRHGITGVLTGGACATIYSAGRYSSGDADFVLQGRVPRGTLDAAMSSIGFVREGNRYTHPSVEFFVEFPSGPLAIGRDVDITPVKLVDRDEHTLALSPTDSCRDRLAAYYHWGDQQSLDAAIGIALANLIDWDVVESWSKGEGAADKFVEFREAVLHNQSQEPESSTS